MDFTMYLNEYIEVLKKFKDFSGRSRRKEFWTFAAINFIIGIVIGILARIPLLGIIFKIVSVLFSLAILIPGIALSIRRLHDTNRPGIMLLLALIPLAGAIIILVFAAQPGTVGENKYGPDPKA